MVRAVRAHPLARNGHGGIGQDIDDFRRDVYVVDAAGVRLLALGRLYLERRGSGELLVNFHPAVVRSPRAARRRLSRVYRIRVDAAQIDARRIAVRAIMVSYQHDRCAFAHRLKPFPDDFRTVHAGGIALMVRVRVREAYPLAAGAVLQKRVRAYPGQRRAPALAAALVWGFREPERAFLHEVEPALEIADGRRLAALEIRVAEHADDAVFLQRPLQVLHLRGSDLLKPDDIALHLAYQVHYVRFAAAPRKHTLVRLVLAANVERTHVQLRAAVRGQRKLRRRKCKDNNGKTIFCLHLGRPI